MRIVFFNHYHNGDIFASKGYIADLIKEFKGHELIYQHYHSPKLLRDLNIEYKSLEIPLSGFSDRTPMMADKNTIYINTWIGNYLPYGDGINWTTYHSMFKKIYAALSDSFDKQIDFGPVEYYYPEISYEYFELPDINIPKKSIIISNGPTLSGQSELPDLDNLIRSILNNTDRHIILTHFSPVNSDRVSFTNNLTKTPGQDLNEIAWISEQCEYIIGRNSGPFCFMTNKKNINDKNKKIISIGNNEKDSFLYKLSIEADYSFYHDRDINSILDKFK